MLTTSDKAFLEKNFVTKKHIDQNFATKDDLKSGFASKNEFFDTVEEILALQKKDHDEVIQLLQGLAGDIKDIQENTTVLSHHNSQHFDKDAEQDKRLDTHAKNLGLPVFTY